MDIIKGKVNWIDIVSPTSDDLEWLKKEFHFHPVIFEELREPSARARVESYDDYLYLIYQFPLYDDAERVSRRTEIDVLITKTSIITVRYDDNPAFNEIKRFLQNEDYKERILSNSLQFVYHLIENILAFNQRQLHHIQKKVEEVSAQLFKDQEEQILRDISYIKRDLSEYRIIFHPQGELLKSLAENGLQFWGLHSKPYLNSLVGDHLKLLNHLEGYRAAIADLESTNNQLMNVKSTQVMKTFTILAFFTFPLVLIANVFSMNTRDMPLVNHPQAFWIVLTAMATLTILLFLYFRSKKWL